jgi:hypothetical protein
VIWLHDNRFPWNKYTFEAAARHGNHDIMNWLRDNGCPTGDET